MMNFLSDVNDWVVTTIESFGMYGAVFSCLLIVVESMIPVLPLTVFIAINFLYYGPILGFIISWIFTLVGCTISFYLSRKVFRKTAQKYLTKVDIGAKLLKKIDKISMPMLAMLVSMPFTPAFAVNIVGGISNMSYRKFITSLVIGKIFLVLFWGFVGVGLVQSLKNPKILFIIGLLLVGAYLIGNIVNKKLKLE